MNNPALHHPSISRGQPLTISKMNTAMKTTYTHTKTSAGKILAALAAVGLGALSPAPLLSQETTQPPRPVRDTRPAIDAATYPYTYGSGYRMKLREKRVAIRLRNGADISALEK